MRNGGVAVKHFPDAVAAVVPIGVVSVLLHHIADQIADVADVHVRLHEMKESMEGYHEKWRSEDFRKRTPRDGRHHQTPSLRRRFR